VGIGRADEGAPGFGVGVELQAEAVLARPEHLALEPVEDGHDAGLRLCRIEWENGREGLPRLGAVGERLAREPCAGACVPARGALDRVDAHLAGPARRVEAERVTADVEWRHPGDVLDEGRCVVRLGLESEAEEMEPQLAGRVAELGERRASRRRALVDPTWSPGVAP